MSISSSPPQRDSNPPSSSSSHVNISKSMTETTRGYEKRGSQGGKPQGVQPDCYLVSCLKCGTVQNVICAFGKPPVWVRCVGCGELQPAAAYPVIVWSWPPLLTPAKLHKISEAKRG